MSMATWQATIQDDDGSVIINPVVTVRDQSSGAISTIYDINGDSIGNPITGGLDGFIQFQAEFGTYIIEAAKGGLDAKDWIWDAIPEDRITALEVLATTGTSPRGAVALATTANVTLSGEQTIDGTLTSGSAVLVRAQTNAAQNGVYTTASGAWTRRADMNAAGEFAGASVYVNGGTDNGGSTFFTASEVTTLGTDPVVWLRSADQGGVKEAVEAYADAGFAAVQQSVGDVRNSFDIDVSADLELAADADGVIYRRVDADGGMQIVGLDKTIQDEFLDRPFKIETVMPATDLMQVQSDLDVILRIDVRGGLYIPGQAGSVQHGLRQSLKRAAQFTTPVRTAREKYATSVQPMMADLAAQGMAYIPAPAMLVPNGYGIPAAVLDEISCSDDNPVGHLKFPYASGGSVHPYLIECREPLHGYRYLMLESNHKNSTAGEETPVMFGSNDLVNFDLLPDVPQPMTHSLPGTDGNKYDGYNSDPFFSYDPYDGALIWGCRDTISDDGDYYTITKTYDGVNWTPKEVFAQNGVSPAILYDPSAEVWRMWLVPSEGALAHYTAASCTGPWTLSSSANFNTAHSIDIWHLEVKYLGDQFALCCHSRDGGTDANAQVYLGLSSDGDTWTMSPGIVQPQSPDVYKPSFLPEFDGDNVRFVFVWSHWDWVNKDLRPEGVPLHVQYTNWVDLTAL